MAGDQGVPHDHGVKAAAERVALRREIEQSDQADVGVREVVLQDQLGNDTPQAMRLVEQHLQSLPPEERARLANATTRDGSRALASPDAVMALLRTAMGPLPRTKAAMEAEIEATRAAMRKDPKAYYANDKIQLRFRAILEALHGPGQR